MNRSSCCNKDCLIISIASSVVIGIVAGILSITGIITVTPAFLWVLFGIAVVYLAIAFVVSSLNNFETPICAKKLIATFLIGVMFTILFSIILLGITFAALSPVAAVLTALLLFAFTLMITSVACLVYGQFEQF